MEKDGVIVISESQVEATCYRIAQISVGLSWSHNMDMHMAGILASHTLSVNLCHLGIAFTDVIQEIVSCSVKDAQHMYYNNYGLPYTKAKGKPPIDFFRKA